MGDDSPKNKHKLVEQKHEEHVKKEEAKHENAEVQHHHSQELPEAEQVEGVPKVESE
jgi:hypothetical protein